MGVRDAKPEDLDGLLSLLYQLSPLKEEDEKVSKEDLQSTLNKILCDKNYCLCVYETEQGKLVSTALLLVQMNLSHGGQPYGHIENVVTNEPDRGKGHGVAVMKYLVNRARELGCYKVILDCEESGKKNNVPFYTKCGFRKTNEVEMRIDL